MPTATLVLTHPLCCFGGNLRDNLLYLDIRCCQVCMLELFLVSAMDLERFEAISSHISLVYMTA